METTEADSIGNRQGDVILLTVRADSLTASTTKASKVSEGSSCVATGFNCSPLSLNYSVMPSV
jgi:hypothetical protein